MQYCLRFILSYIKAYTSYNPIIIINRNPEFISLGKIICRDIKQIFIETGDSSQSIFCFHYHKY